eukprot:gene18602-18891_t
MRAVLQRVSEASCSVEGEITGAISGGFLVLLGVEDTDTTEDMQWLAQKITGMRVFGDENGLMNKALADVDGSILLISQFTLFAQTKKGNRPSFIRAARPDKAIPLYEQMITVLEGLTGKKVQTGIFGADMKVSLEMEIKEAQQLVDKWINTKGIRYFNELTNTAILMEEVGEVARIMARQYGEQSFKKSDTEINLADEMADVLFVLICLANQTGIDLTVALEKNMEKKSIRDADRHRNNEKLK